MSLIQFLTLFTIGFGFVTFFTAWWLVAAEDR